ncbi:MAG: biotin transporter BioY [Desulfarculaceae bacterium]|nr:biotin transporter BioY [Desulfarculaceae bacterium]
MNFMNQLRMMTYASLFVALIAAGAFISIPVGPVPIVLQNMFVLLAGLLLGPRWGLASVFIYLLLGTFGLPVFAGGTGGIGRILGPTGGYLIGYLPCVYATGLIARKNKRSRLVDISAMITGSVILYAAGVPWLKFATGMGWEKAFMAGMYPFLPGNAVKIVAAAFIAGKLRPLMKG